MRADEHIEKWEELCCHIKDVDVIDYINQLRYERLMAKARYFKDVCEGGLVRDIDKYQRCLNIAEAYEERARRIKEGM